MTDFNSQIDVELGRIFHSAIFVVILEGCADTWVAGHLLNLRNVFPSAALYPQGSSLKIHIQEVRRPKYERSEDPFAIEIFEVLLIASHKKVCLVINSS